ncbi:hypothetical protein N6H18_12470 [Reichenbachiella agarivorans]|uniref:Four helix bundle protein n=1 Tax=Reichenbachiella agarivorans TaxID=2979464 RepID=A0ABY6CNX6_9BACT|nr:hypothetical protein [Reichenbachiella agarivorans]UXP31163.1 hypothetical protein N6H18_12470 [Reichenbachiella agarivorans]
MTKSEYEIAPENHAIYQKGIEIYDLVSRVCAMLPTDNVTLQEVRTMMLSDALQLSSKVEAAQGAELYDLKMEAATMIRKSAKDLLVQNHALTYHGFKDAQYFDLIRDGVEEYRLLFIEWVRGFDKSNYITDRWGLFNPPGVDPNDQIHEESISFDAEDYLK